ncbi:MAG: Mur ligase domain-containing protein, partial [Raoultibacter sp.]
MTDKRIETVHFIGIGGVGMSGIARVAHDQGMKVSGSDLKESRYT